MLWHREALNLIVSLQFQYSHISNYGVQVTRLWKADRRRRRAAEHALIKDQETYEKSYSELTARIRELEKSETKLEKWEQRKSMINHYLGMVGRMGE